MVPIPTYDMKEMTVLQPHEIHTLLLRGPQSLMDLAVYSDSGITEHAHPHIIVDKHHSKIFSSAHKADPPLSHCGQCAPRPGRPQALLPSHALTSPTVLLDNTAGPIHLHSRTYPLHQVDIRALAVAKISSATATGNSALWLGLLVKQLALTEYYTTSYR